MMTLDILLTDSRSFILPESVSAMLSASGQARLAQMHADARRQQFLLGRWLMSQAADCELAAIEERDNYPLFARNPTLHASISHSGPYVAVLVSKGMRCGLDIEYPTRQRNWPALAERAFSPEETAWINAAAPEAQAEHFHRIWTLREAAFKAGLLTGVVGHAPVFHPEKNQALDQLHWQYRQYGAINLSVVGPMAFDIAVHEISLPV